MHVHHFSFWVSAALFLYGRGMWWAEEIQMMGLHYYTWNMSFTTNIIWSVSQADTEGLWFVTNHSLWRCWSVLVWTNGWGWILSILAQVYTHFLAVNEMENKVWLIWMFLLLWCASALMSECCTKAKGTRLCPWCLNQYRYRVMEFSICAFFQIKTCNFSLTSVRSLSLCFNIHNIK